MLFFLRQYPIVLRQYQQTLTLLYFPLPIQHNDNKLFIQQPYFFNHIQFTWFNHFYHTLFYEQLHYPLISPWDEFINFPPTNNFTCTHLLINQPSYPYSLILSLLFLFISSLPYLSTHLSFSSLFPPSPLFHLVSLVTSLPFPSYIFLHTSAFHIWACSFLPFSLTFALWIIHSSSITLLPPTPLTWHLTLSRMVSFPVLSVSSFHSIYVHYPYIYSLGPSLSSLTTFSPTPHSGLITFCLFYLGHILVIFSTYTTH